MNLLLFLRVTDYQGLKLVHNNTVAARDA